MYKLTGEAVNLVKAILVELPHSNKVEVAVAPPFTALFSVANLISNTDLRLAAQNAFWEREGAYTGEISPLMLKDIGCEYVIIGHSERRQYFWETDKMVALKIKAVLEEGLRPILCVGEKLEQREAGETFKIVKKQLLKGLEEVDENGRQKTVIAYEPVWAIGTGKTAFPYQAQEIHKYLRQLLEEKWSKKAAEGIRIIYGGSVKPENITNLMQEEDIDGALVGGASLEAETFIKIINYGVR
jgi:triosephosphate isomerase